MNKQAEYRVTAWAVFRGVTTRRCYTFRYYWQANLCSWLLRHVLGYYCNTWKVHKI